MPPRRDIDERAGDARRDLFAQLGCVELSRAQPAHGQHVPFLELRDQVIHPYTDLLLHDMGPDLADNSQGEYAATPTMWRTPPLWAIGLCDEVAAGYQKDQTLNPAPNLGPLPLPARRPRRARCSMPCCGTEARLRRSKTRCSLCRLRTGTLSWRSSNHCDSLAGRKTARAPGPPGSEWILVSGRPRSKPAKDPLSDPGGPGALACDQPGC